jgi:hypothetical protein
MNAESGHIRHPPLVSPRFLVLLLAILSVCAGLVVILPATVGQVNDLFPGPLPDHWYPVTQDAFLVYGVTPVVILASIVLLLAPGFFVAVALGKPRDTIELVLMTILLSVVLHFFTFSVIKLVTAQPDQSTYRGAIIGTSLVAWAILTARVLGGSVLLPIATPEDRRRLVWLGAVSLITLYLLFPFIFWQDFNPDGLEILTMGRSLDLHLIPRLPTGAPPGLGVGMIAATYPVHWFISLFGPSEAAARLPLLLYVPLLLAGLLGLIEWKSTRSLRRSEEFAVVLGLSVVIAAMALNDAYHAYAVDIASPANIDLLAVAGMVAATYFVWAGRPGWFLAFATFTFLTRPTGLMFLGLLGIGIAVSVARDKGARLRIVGLALIGCILITIAYNQALDPSNMGNIMSRLRFLRFDDFGRVLFMFIPAGILPPFALFLVRDHDSISRTLTLITFGYLAFFYVVAFVALHHFTPVMVLPLVVFWRVVVRGPWRPVLVGATVVAAAVALALVQPRCYMIDRTMRTLGHATDYKIGQYDGEYAEYREAFEQKGLLDSLFRPWHQVEDPSTEFFGSSWLHIRYAAQPTTTDINYVVQPLDDPEPTGFTTIAANDIGAVFVKDLDRWHRDQRTPPRTDCRSPVLELPTETLYRRWGEPAHNYSVDMRHILQRVIALVR